MPIHDWTRVEPGDFHDFHLGWITNIANALNMGGLPPGFMAMIEQVSGWPNPDVVVPQTRRSAGVGGAVSVRDVPPTARVVTRFENAVYARRASRVVIRHGRDQAVAMIEIMSPGNKASRNALRSFVEKAVDILNQGVNLLIVDLFPPTPRDPHGIHSAIWEEFGEGPFEAPPGKPLTVASYLGGEIPTAYVEPVGVGDPLPSLPIFLSEEEYVPAPLEATYSQAWAVYPTVLKELVESAPPGA